MITNFMIEMHEKYDDIKFQRAFRKGFYGIQVCFVNL